MLKLEDKIQWHWESEKVRLGDGRTVEAAGIGNI